MIGATLRTITGRRGSFLGGAGVVFLGVVITIIVYVVVHAHDEFKHPSVGGHGLLDATAAVVGLVGVIVAILIGALAGSYDTAQGTMRYLVMTGAKRGGIYRSRSIAVVAAVWLALAPAATLAIAASLVLPHVAVDSVSTRDVGSWLWTVGLTVTVFALISMGIGALLRSNGPAIAISLVVNLGLAPLLLLLGSLSKNAADLALPGALGVVTGSNSSVPYALAAVALAAQVGVFVGAGWLRVQRDEY